MRARLWAVLVAATAVIGGCGDDKPSSTATARTTVDGTPGASSAGDGSGAAGGVDGVVSQRCAETAVAMAKAASSVSEALSGTPGELQKSVGELEAFTKAAPAEIRSDLEVVAKGYASVISILLEAKYDPSSGKPPSPKSIKKLEAAGNTLDDAEFSAASERVSDWFAQKCGK